MVCCLPSVLIPSFHLCVGEIQPGGELDAVLNAQILVRLEAPLQRVELKVVEGRARFAIFFHVARARALAAARASTPAPTVATATRRSRPSSTVFAFVLQLMAVVVVFVATMCVSARRLTVFSFSCLRNFWFGNRVAATVGIVFLCRLWCRLFLVQAQQIAYQKRLDHIALSTIHDFLSSSVFFRV